jgi:hypothetical protein
MIVFFLDGEQKNPNNLYLLGFFTFIKIIGLVISSNKPLNLHSSKLL